MSITNNNKTVPNLRVGPLTNIAFVLELLGCKPEPVFESVGFDMQQFQDSSTLISFTAASRLLEACAKLTKCDHFGLLLGQWFLPSQLGSAAQGSLSSADVRSALQNIMKDLYLHDQGGVLTLTSSDLYTSFGYAIHLQGIAGIEQVYDLSCTNCCMFMRSLCGDNWAPTEVHLSRSKPEDCKPYNDFFGANVKFNAFETKLIFSNKWLNHPIASTAFDDQIKMISDETKLQESLSPQSFRLSVSEVLCRDFPNDLPTITKTAQLFNMHERSLHRKLQAEGTNFRQLLDQTRQSISEHYLSNTAIPPKDIALALGYNSTGAFDHAFKRWLDMSPTKWRQSRNKSEVCAL